MLRYLTKRPVAVLMSTLSFVVLGIIAFVHMPVSLLPEIDIPTIKIILNNPAADARELENSAVKPLRLALMQINGLENINSISHDGKAEIQLNLSHSTNTDLAFIEVNEKIDASMNMLPAGMERPLIIKEKPSDIPVFYINIVPNDEFFSGRNNFLSLSEFAEMTVKRRLEQLAEVAMVDISGLSKQEIIIKPFYNKLLSLDISVEDIVNSIESNNFLPSNLSFRDGYYVYRLRVLNPLSNVNSLKNLILEKNGRLYKLSSLADISLAPNTDGGIFYHNNKRAISMAVYKQADARMQDIKRKIDKTLVELKKTEPDIEFNIERDQSKLLEFSLNNLLQTLVLGLILAIVILFVFIRQPKLPLVIAISIPVSLLISFFFLQLAGISINIISLSGLILSVGLMIDNSIIVVDNINQHRYGGKNTFEATVAGTNEIIRPLISSVLTTCAVFLPMIALSGIAGALFYDQALTISISLGVSLLISIMVTPVLYNSIVADSQLKNQKHKLLEIYERGLHLVMAHKTATIIVFATLIPLMFILFYGIKKEKFPAFSQSDILMEIDWNQALIRKQNYIQTKNLISHLYAKPADYSVYVDEDQFIMNNNSEKGLNITNVYLDFGKPFNTEKFKTEVEAFLQKNYPSAICTFYPSENIFNSVFRSGEDEILALVRQRNSNFTDKKSGLQLNSLIEKYQPQYFEKIALNNRQFSLKLKHDNLLLYDVDQAKLIEKLKTIFGGNSIGKLNNGNQLLEIKIEAGMQPPQKVIDDESIKNKQGEFIPLSALLVCRQSDDLKSITSDNKGEYLSLKPKTKTGVTEFETKVKSLLKNSMVFDADFAGSLYSRKILFLEFLKVMLISLALLYLILAAQFESLLLPVIILIEISFDITAALLFLWLFGSSLNIMSAIGIIIMSGIVINDSIIKIDTIKKSLDSGMNLTEAIYEGGHRRFYPIVMTSLTTILALVPLLFYSGMGVALQLPLALTIIGGLAVGTIVSLYFIPLMFYFVTRKSKN